ncbi:unnamed protein product [Phaeothamnion confervicola]
MKVAVVSVVGAFRTGKSFLLSFFLRFLRHAEESSDEWITADGAALREGNLNLGSEPAEVGAAHSFPWRGGVNRQTTGIWMWSEPFVRTVASGEEVAILLMDTQGMFDNETSMGLTACIFGLSTLLSSYQIYNVEKRVQENHLQQLALFSEYGRMALATDLSRDGDRYSGNGAGSGAGIGGNGGSGGAAASASPPPPPASSGGESASSASPKPAVSSAPFSPLSAKAAGGASSSSAVTAAVTPPFQRVEFLVRDWQDFDADDDASADAAALQRQMESYLREVIRDREVKDLQNTREQITSCFETITCFGLPHPGFEVIKRAYDGKIESINPLFRRLLDAYARQVFGPRLEPKRIHGRQLTAPELGTYVAAYVDLFQKGADFPAAQTMLEATAAANNANAAHAALARYKVEMDKAAGPGSGKKYMDTEQLAAHHAACRDGALKVFDGTATMGRRKAIEEARAGLLADVASELERFAALNASRNPFQNLEYYLVPLLLAVVAFVARPVFILWIADTSCSSWSETCRKASDGFGHVYVGIFFFLLIISANRIKQLADYVGKLVPVLTAAAVGGGGGGAAAGGGGHLKVS